MIANAPVCIFKRFLVNQIKKNDNLWQSKRRTKDTKLLWMNVWSCKILYNIYFNVESNKNVIELLQFLESHTSQLPNSAAQLFQSPIATNLKKAGKIFWQI
jgi:hypothetical protein